VGKINKVIQEFRTNISDFDDRGVPSTPPKERAHG